MTTLIDVSFIYGHCDKRVKVFVLASQTADRPREQPDRQAAAIWFGLTRKVFELEPVNSTLAGIYFQCAL